MRIGILTALLSAMLAGCSAGRGGTECGGRATFSIVLPDAPKPWEKTAAAELEHYLGLCLGDNRIKVEGRDAVVFHVGDTAFARLAYVDVEK